MEMNSKNFQSTRRKGGIGPIAGASYIIAMILLDSLSFSDYNQKILPSFGLKGNQLNLSKIPNPHEDLF